MDNCFSLKNQKKEFQKNGVYHSDEKVAEWICSRIPQDVQEVYDPTCGVGGLLKYFSNDVKKYGEEINADMCEIAREIPNSTIINTDTLKAPKFLDRKFKAIVANYPFSVKWEPAEDERFKGLPCLPPPSKADYAFIFHILYLLDNEGIASVLCFPGILYRGNKEKKLRQYLVENNLIDSISKVPANSFEDTKIETALIVFKKNRQENAPITFIDEENKKEVFIEEIKENDYNLSIRQYVQQEVEKEVINPFEVEKEERERIKRILFAKLSITTMIIENDFHEGEDIFNKTSFNNYLDELKDVINGFYMK